MKRFEHALFRAPKQSQEAKPVHRRRTRNQVPLFSCEIVGDKSVAMLLDHFEITTQRRRGQHDRTNCRAFAVTE